MLGVEKEEEPRNGSYIDVSGEVRGKSYHQTPLYSTPYLPNITILYVNHFDFWGNFEAYFRINVVVTHVLLGDLIPAAFLSCTVSVLP
jgi:hypothetical protein